MKYSIWPGPKTSLLSWLWHLLYNFGTFLIRFAWNSCRITPKQWFTLSCWLKHCSISIILLAYSLSLTTQNTQCWWIISVPWLLNFNSKYLVFHWSPLSCFLIAWLVCQPCASLRRKKQVSCDFFWWMALTWMSQRKECKSCNKQSVCITLLAVVRLSACSLQCANSGSATSCNKTQLASTHSLSDTLVEKPFGRFWIWTKNCPKILLMRPSEYLKRPNCLQFSII